MSAALCDYCGHHLPNAAGPGLYCPECGTPVASERAREERDRRARERDQRERERSAELLDRFGNDDE